MCWRPKPLPAMRQKAKVSAMTKRAKPAVVVSPAPLMPATTQDAWREADREEQVRQLARLGAAMPRVVRR